MSETEEASCSNAVSGMDGSLGGVKYGAPYGANKHFQCLRTIQTEVEARKDLVGTNHMWHLKLPLNMEKTSPNPLIQALL